MVATFASIGYTAGAIGDSVMVLAGMDVGSCRRGTVAPTPCNCPASMDKVCYPCKSCTEKCYGIPCLAFSITYIGFLIAMLLDLMAFLGCVLGIPTEISIILALFLFAHGAVPCNVWRCLKCRRSVQQSGPTQVEGQQDAVVGQPIGVEDKA